MGKWSRRSLLACTYLAICAIVLSSCGASTANSLPQLSPSVGDRDVLFVGNGTGSRVIQLAVPVHKRGAVLPGGVLAIVAVCSGSGSVVIRLEPGGENDSPSCRASGGGWSISGPAKLAWPSRMTVTAQPGTSWRIAVVDPYGSTGVSQTAK